MEGDLRQEVQIGGCCNPPRAPGGFLSEGMGTPMGILKSKEKQNLKDWQQCSEDLRMPPQVMSLGRLLEDRGILDSN